MDELFDYCEYFEDYHLSAIESKLEELAGMDRLFLNQQPLLYKLTCKLEGLFILETQDDFMTYRGIIFECLGIVGELQKCL